MSTVAATCGGEVAIIVVSLITEKLAATVPKLTALAPVKFVPVMVTTAPPADVPELGLTAVTAGAEAALKVNRSPIPKADVPAALTTEMSQVPAALGAVTAVIMVSELIVKLAAAAGPKLTADAIVKPLPMIVTEVPPAVLPEVGLMLVTVGTGTAV
jgi:hypothetical protein